MEYRKTTKLENVFEAYQMIFQGNTIVDQDGSLFKKDENTLVSKDTTEIKWQNFDFLLSDDVTYYVCREVKCEMPKMLTVYLDEEGTKVLVQEINTRFFIQIQNNWMQAEQFWDKYKELACPK